MGECSLGIFADFVFVFVSELSWDNGLHTRRLGPTQGPESPRLPGMGSLTPVGTCAWALEGSVLSTCTPCSVWGGGGCGAEPWVLTGTYTEVSLCQREYSTK